MGSDVEPLPVVVLRLLNGRVGSTLVMQLLATSPRVVFDRVYPFGEYRYLSYCMRMSAVMAREHDPEVDRVTPFFFASDAAGPIPWDPQLFDRDRLKPFALRGLWGAMSAAIRERQPEARWYAEKLVEPVDELTAAGIECKVLDVVRDPRDVLASIRSFTARGIDGMDRRPGEHDASYLARFVSDAQQRLALVAEPCACDRMVVRYEDFARDLHGLAGSLGAWIGESLDAATVLGQRASYAHHVTTATVDDSIGRWRRDLDRAEADLIWSRLGDQLRSFGYTAR